ncbi:MAG: dockerin type I domain-containing protein [Dehalococcoidia bacterium]
MRGWAPVAMVRRGLLWTGLAAAISTLLVFHRQAEANPLDGIVSAAAGESHTCALTAGGGVLCWGFNIYGQVGDGTGGMNAAVVRRTSPAQVVGLGSGAAAIAVGSNHSCALTTFGGAKCWGNNFAGQVGAITSDKCDYLRILQNDGGGWPCAKTAVDVMGLENGVTAITAGTGLEGHSCAATELGRVKCWGDNYNGQLGAGPFGPASVVPREVCIDYDSGKQQCAESLTGVTGVSAGAAHTCALTEGGEVWCWGNNTSGQLGMPQGTPCFTDSLGYNDFCRTTAVPACETWDDGQQECATRVDNAVALTAGGSHTCALFDPGGVRCWGNNEYGQLGTATEDACRDPSPWLDEYFSCSFTPVEPTNLASSVSAVDAGRAYTCALVSGSGGMKCWGSNFSGRLGIGTMAIESTVTPLDVCNVYDIDQGRCEQPLSDLMAISAGGEHTCAVTVATGLKCWGSNGDGQLGNGCYVPNILRPPIHHGNPKPGNVLVDEKSLRGDADRDLFITPLDALAILQVDAGLTNWLRCPNAADVNGDDHVNALDAALVLQHAAGPFEL